MTQLELKLANSKATAAELHRALYSLTLTLTLSFCTLAAE